MDEQKVDMFIITNGKYFESHQVNTIRKRLLKMEPARWTMLQSTSFNDPTLLLVVSILVGGLGVDRFIIGDVGLGVWTIVDWFLIMGATKEKNLDKIRPYFQ